jgi:hypothetical protein
MVAVRARTAAERNFMITIARKRYEGAGESENTGSENLKPRCKSVA